jgi:hypothetical protein
MNTRGSNLAPQYVANAGQRVVVTGLRNLEKQLVRG